MKVITWLAGPKMEWFYLRSRCSCALLGEVLVGASGLNTKGIPMEILPRAWLVLSPLFWLLRSKFPHLFEDQWILGKARQLHGEDSCWLSSLPPASQTYPGGTYALIPSTPFGGAPVSSSRKGAEFKAMVFSVSMVFSCCFLKERPSCASRTQ